MATRKAPAAIADEIVEEVKDEAVHEATAEEQPYDIWEDYVEMMVPRAHKGEDESIFVMVNNRSAHIPLNGKIQKIRRPWAEILKAHFDAEAASEEYADHIPNDEPLNGSARV